MDNLIKQEPIMGICIPTYNRASILKDNLINIVKTIGRYQIPIYISDNCSTDNTKEMVLEMQHQYPNIFYSKNDENYGVDRNIEIAFKLCRQEYAWLLGDDDTINNDISKIIQVLSEIQPDVLVLGIEKNVKEGLYTDKLKVLYDITYQMTWMSGDIIATKLLEDFDFKRYYGTNFVHSGAILDYIGRFDTNLYYLNNEYVSIMRPGFVAYNDRILEIYAKGWTELIMRLPGFSYEEKLKQCILRTKKSGMLNNKILLSLRAQGYLNLQILKEYQNYIALYNKSPYILLCAISAFPIKVSAMLRKIYKVFYKRKINTV